MYNTTNWACLQGLFLNRMLREIAHFSAKIIEIDLMGEKSPGRM